MILKNVGSPSIPRARIDIPKETIRTREAESDKSFCKCTFLFFM